MLHPIPKPGQFDLRATPRAPTRYVRMLSPVWGEVLNRSESGLQVESIDSLPVGQIRSIQLSRPETSGQTTAIEALEVEVCWCRLHRTDRWVDDRLVPVYRSGLRIVEPSSR